ncbi:LysR substrate-binding domain-containing protein [Mesorhizobium sp. M0761]|uniref:LysR family transcriptional regulator n=1 Tax=Mesorhizobium sp. M0761 TaxID=2956994 RepID=UPI003337A03C
MLNKIDLARADLNLLVLFQAIMEERHVGRSAERLNLSASAVSHGLGRLRKVLGDPLFLKTPRGVVPTDRATELAEPVAEILARVRRVIASAEPFDPARSTRRFTIGAPDAVSSVLLPPLLDQIRLLAPGIDIGIRQLLPRQGEPSPTTAWSDCVAELEARAMDVAVIPFDGLPARFTVDKLYEEDFVVAMRAGHRFAGHPCLDAYCSVQHMVVSSNGDPNGFVDRVLAERGLSRRVALTVPNFMFGLAVLAQTDLISAYPRRFLAMYGGRFGVVGVDTPIRLGHFNINSIVPKVALMDAGLAWLVGLLKQSGNAARTGPA